PPPPDSPGGVQRKAARKDAEPTEELLLLAGAELVAPLDRRAQRPLALGEIAPRRREDGQASVEPREKLAGREDLDARRRQLDRKREAVEAAADFREWGGGWGESRGDG